MRQNKIPSYIFFLAHIFLLFLFCFTLLRLLFFFINNDTGGNIPVIILLNSFIMGVRFDTVISCYILLIPFIVLGFQSLLKPSSTIWKFVSFFIILMMIIAFFIVIADIPYYKQFNSRITIASLNWIDQPSIMLQVMFGNSLHWVLFLIFLVMSIISAFLIVRIRKGIIITESSLLIRVIYFILIGVLIFYGMRGRFQKKSPIRWGTAFFSSYFFANQMALNPVFTFIRTGLDRINGKDHINFMPVTEALSNVRKTLHLDPKENEGGIQRNVTFKEEPLYHNVVLVFMESMSAYWMSRYRNEKNLTPYLDSLAINATYIHDHFYSAGIHTFNGIHSTLYGIPAPMQLNPLKGYLNMKMSSGLPIALSENGYHTVFLCPHDAQFDNIGGYVLANGYKQLISQKDFPSSEVINTFGVPDHILFNTALETLNKTGSNPLFITILTCSNHIPLKVPEGITFKPKGETDREHVVSYSDWAIGQFMHKAAKQPWYKNTIFIFLADHGMPIDPVYDIPLSSHHIPLIIYIPQSDNHDRINGFGGQIDVFPTVMGLLRQNYTNTSLGIDLLKEQRNCVFFSADDKLACLNDSLYFIERLHADNSLFKYRNGNRSNILNKNKSIAEEMKRLSESMVQYGNYLLSNNPSN